MKIKSKQCAVPSCHTEANVHLTRNLDKPNWFCAHCASHLLESVNPFSFKTFKEMSLEEEREELKKLQKIKK